MKISMIQVTLAMIFAGVVTANDNFAQKVLDREVHVKVSEVSLERVLQKIEESAHVKFVYSRSHLNLDEKISMEAYGKPLGEVLKALLEPREIRYLVQEGNDYIILKHESQARSSMNDAIDALATEMLAITVTGTVTDGSGITIPGVSVMVKGTTTGTVTDVDGNYSLSVVDMNAVLVFSSIGYMTQEVEVNGKTVIDVALQEDVQNLEEVVVVGYATQKKETLTGAVDVISGEALENRPAQNVGLLLQGTAPGLNVSISSAGGEPGAAPTFNIRGTGTLSGGGAPLVLVDGVEMNINNLSPDDIESVTVLKDAASSAIYGSRAPFGVILITTKKGEKNQPISIRYNNFLSWSNPIGLPHFVDALTWAEAYNQASANGGQSPVYAAEQIDRIKGYMAGTYPHEYDIDNPPNSIYRSRWEGNTNYDWPAMFYRKNAFSQKHNINLGGGDANTRYYVSAGYYDQEGIWNWGQDSYKRYNVTANVSSQVTKWLRFDLSTKYAKSKTDYPLGQAGANRQRIWNSMKQFGPMQPYHNADGTINNPLVAQLQKTGRDLGNDNDSWITLAAEIEPVKGWKTKISYNYNYGSFSQAKNPFPIEVNVPNGSVGNIGYSYDGYETLLSQREYNLANIVSSYAKTIGDHYVLFLAGYEQEADNYRSLFGARRGLITQAVPSISTTTDLESTELDDEISHWTNQGFFGRLNYNYQEKYLIEFNARYNGSSRFAEASRWGFFPSASAGYMISKENFWSGAERYVNTLKFRASYGSLGNQRVANYLHLPTLPVTGNLEYLINDSRPMYAGIPGIVSSDLTWETITTLDFGLDAEFLKNRLAVSFDWYDRVTSDMLGPAEELPASLGTKAPQSNNAKLSTKGFEISIDWKGQVFSDAFYNVRFILGDNRTTVLEYRNVEKLIDTYYPGKELGEVWGYTTDKIMQNDADVQAMADQSKLYSSWGPGDIAYKDVNGDGAINDGTRTLDEYGDLSRIGNEKARYNFGVSAGLNWKGFDFSMFWQGIGKRDFAPDRNDKMFWGMVSGGSLGSESALFRNGWMMDYWRPAGETNSLGPNTDAYFPKPSWVSGDIRKNHQPQSRYIVNAAYLRLKNIQLGYTLPQEISKKLLLENARIYFSGADLLTFSKLPEIIDPEISMTKNGGADFYPLSSSISFGVNLTF